MAPPVAAALAAVAMLALVMNSYLRVGALAGDSWAFRKTLGEGQRVAYERPPAHMIHRLRESYGGAGTKVARPKPALTRAPLTRATLHCRLHSQSALSGCTAASVSRYRRTQILRGQLATRNCRTFSTRTRSSGFRRGIQWAPRWGLCCAPFRYFAACIVPRAFVVTWCSRSALRTPDDRPQALKRTRPPMMRSEPPSMACGRNRALCCVGAFLFCVLCPLRDSMATTLTQSAPFPRLIAA